MLLQHVQPEAAALDFFKDGMKSVTLNDMDGEIAELMYKTIRKLEAMTDAEFEELYIMPDGMVDD